MFLLAGRTSDYIGARALLSQIPHAASLLVDRGYNAEWFRNETDRNGDFNLHPVPDGPEGSDPTRRRSLPPTPRDREHVRQVEGLASDRYPLRSLPHPACAVAATVIY